MSPMERESVKNKRKLFPVVFCVALVIFLGVGVYGFNLTTPVDKTKTAHQNFVVKKGQSARSIIKALYKERLIRSEKLAYYLARFWKISFKAGNYKLSKSMSLKEVFAELTTGKQLSVKVTIAEGLTLTKVAQTLEKAKLVKSEDFLTIAHSGEALKSYGVEAMTCEGFLFPDTYFFTENETAESVLNLMIKTFFEKISEIENFPSSGAEILEAVKLASIVEREYRVPDEVATIAGVFKNRLDIQMALQSCTTVEYIITEIQHKPHPTRIFWEDLEIDSPYNTYIYKGLPPTPICSPGLLALKAVATPEKHDYLYFRLVDEKTGRHSFSKTFSEHNSKSEGFKLKK